MLSTFFIFVETISSVFFPHMILSAENSTEIAEKSIISLLRKSMRKGNIFMSYLDFMVISVWKIVDWFATLKQWGKPETIKTKTIKKKEKKKQRNRNKNQNQNYLSAKQEWNLFSFWLFCFCSNFMKESKVDEIVNDKLWFSMGLLENPN